MRRPTSENRGRRVGAALALLALSALAAAGPALAATPAWTTWHGDAVRSGFDAVDAPAPFAPAWSHPGLDGPVFASPLVYGNRVYVATANNAVYALDTATGQVAWQASAGPPVPASKLPCGNVTPNVGIVSTPVIDPATSTLYAVADTWTGTTARHVLVGYDLATGTPRFAPRTVDPTAANTPGGDSTLALLQRAALNLDGGRVVFGFGGNAGDCGAYHGWVVSVPEDPAGATAFYKVPTTREGAVWAPGGPAVAGDGSVYVATGNGEQTSTYDHGDSVIQLSPDMRELGYFASPTWAQDNATDADLGSATPALLPGGLLFQAGKNGNGYLVPTALGGHPGPAYQAAACRSFGGQAFDGARLYVSCADGVRALTVSSAPARFAIAWHGPADAKGSPIVAGGLVWSIAYDAGRLYGLDRASGAVRVSQPIPIAQHFATPAAAGGRLFAAAGSTLLAYTIGTPPPDAPPPAPALPPPAPPAPPAAPAPAARCPTMVRLRVATRRGHHIRRVLVQVDRGRLRAGRVRHHVVRVHTPHRRTFTVRAVVTWRDGRTVAYSRHFTRCTASRQRARVLHR